MQALHRRLPFHGRVALLIGIFGLAAGAALMSYQFYRRPVILTLVAGSSDGEARQIASIIAGRLATTNSPVRLRIENAGTAVDAAKAFATGSADLAIVRADVGNLHDARAVAVTARGVLTIVAPPGSAISDVARLRGHTVGVVGADVNRGIVDALTREYDLDRASFRDVAPQEARQALQSKAVSALLMVAPLTEKHLAWIKSLFRDGAGSSPVLIPVDAAGAIADRKGPYESFDIPKGTLRGAPAVPADDVTTLRVGYYLVANRHLNANVVGDLARKVMGVRRDLVGEQPLLSGIAAPDLDADAFLPAHPGAAAFFNGTQESFMDRYANVIYLTPMVLGALASVFAGAWRFLGVRRDEADANVLEQLCVLPARIRLAPDEAGLSAIEAEIDNSLGTRLTRIAGEEDHASEAAMLIAAASRLDHLLYQRRAMLAWPTTDDLDHGLADLFVGGSGANPDGRPNDGMPAGHSAA
jgi:TRAP-type uncharacterized transport system substrate-binding protein